MQACRPSAWTRDAPAFPCWVFVLAVLWAAPVADARADELQIDVQDLDASLLEPVQQAVKPLEVSGEIRLSARRVRDLAAQSERAAELALRPYGYYQAQARSQVKRGGDRAWSVLLSVDPGPPQRIVSAQVEVIGPGAGLPELVTWRKSWPLGVGQITNQATWEAEKQRALDACEAHGYLAAEFTEKAIEMDLEDHTATTRLVLDTGPRAVMGTVQFDQDEVRPEILAILPRFQSGQPYDAWLLEKFRLDLWRTGYFDNVELIEERRLEEQPPRVNLVMRGQSRKPNSYQGSLGWGTDTGIRAQAHWRRSLLSERGDQMDVGLGWQEKFNQYSFRTGYRRPRLEKAREYWTADLLVTREQQDLDVKASEIDDQVYRLASGDVTDYSFKAGRLLIRDFEQGYQQIFETWYGQYLYETVSYDPNRLEGAQLLDDELVRELSDNTSVLAFGINWDWPDIRGSGFDTEGHHERAWITASNESWGSSTGFIQAYASSSWHYLGERWKLLLRGELGYTNADVRDLSIDIEDQTIALSLTTLPNAYRFKAGGSRSVRGYSFESLSNNGVGSNNVITASAEVEMNFRRDWSVAAFVDTGNAFNDWGEYELRKGVGVGVRWYSIAGPVRLDFAQALDLEGDPWRIHFTIGTPLL